MSRVKNKDTDLECKVRSALHKRGYRFRKHVKTLPGSPDVVFPKQKVAVFIDGDFWHGYKFYTWEDKVGEFWKNKIRKNRERDRKNFRALRHRGWNVIRLWQHDIERDNEKCVVKIIAVVEQARRRKTL